MRVNNFSSNAISEAGLILPKADHSANVIRRKRARKTTAAVVNLQQRRLRYNYDLGSAFACNASANSLKRITIYDDLVADLRCMRCNQRFRESRHYAAAFAQPSQSA